jgi:hypothetical protein
MSELRRQELLQRIKRNIRQHGCHVYIVVGSAVPRYAYTIGLWETLRLELILPGASYYTTNEVNLILQAIHRDLIACSSRDSSFPVDELGSFRLREAHGSWTRALLLGAYDYYQGAELKAYQVVPDDEHWTIDIPDLREEWSAQTQPIWQWLHEGWAYPIPRESTATTNVDALRGAKITEVVRWEEEEWEMFAGPGPDVSAQDARTVPLGTLLGADPSLRPAVDLQVGKGLWRAADAGEWHPWSKKNSK